MPYLKKGRKQGKAKGKKSKKSGQGKSVTQLKKQQQTIQEEEYAKVPHAFVFNRGQVGRNVQELLDDVRKIMEPYCARNLKANKKNSMKDFVSMAGPLNVSHMVIFTKTEIGTYLKICRVPRGPTLTFKVAEYCLARDVISSLKRHNTDPKQFNQHPLLVMNNFGSDALPVKLMSTMFQNMFPSININKVKLGNIQRVLILNYDTETKLIDLRHYNIQAVPLGMSRGVKKLVKTKIPNLGLFDDVSEFLLRGNLSESEGEMDGPHNEVILPQDMPGKGNMKSLQSAIRLTELGPRLTLQLVKIEEGICQGNILFHELVIKTEDEKRNVEKYRKQKKKLKVERKREQLKNVRRKEQEKEDHKAKSLAGMAKDDEVKAGDAEDADDADDEDNNVNKSTGNLNKGGDDDDDDDVEYYRQEVGEEPDADTMKGLIRKRKMPRDGSQLRKRMRPDSVKKNQNTGNKSGDERKGFREKKGKFAHEGAKNKLFKKKSFIGKEQKSPKYGKQSHGSKKSGPFKSSRSKKR